MNQNNDHNDNNLTRKPEGSSHQDNTPHLPSRRKDAQKRLLIYAVLLFAASIIIVLVAFLPQFIYRGGLSDNHPQLQAMISEAEGARSAMERLQSELQTLRHDMDRLSAERAELEEELDVLRLQSSEMSQSLSKAESVINRYEEERALLEARITASASAARLISAYAAENAEQVNSLAVLFESPDLLALLDADVRDAVENILQDIGE